MADGAAFAANIKDLVAKYKTRIGDVIVQSVQELGDRVVQRTPVDTGYARNSWFSSVDGAKSAHPSQPSKGQPGVAGSAGGAPGIMPADIQAAPGHVYQLRNGAVYIRRLEYGHSAKAPEGMVRITIAEFPQIVEQAARQVGAK